MHCADICLSATHNESARKLVMTQFEPCQYRHKSRYASVLQNRCFYTYIWLAYLVRFFERLLRQTTPKLLPLFECLPLLFLLMSLRYSVFPNSKGTGVGLGANDGGQFLYINWSGSLQPYGQAWAGYDRHADQTDRDFGTNFLLDLSKGNPIFSDLISTVQPTAIRGLWLLKAY